MNKAFLKPLATSLSVVIAGASSVDAAASIMPKYEISKSNNIPSVEKLANKVEQPLIIEKSPFISRGDGQMLAAHYSHTSHSSHSSHGSHCSGFSYC